MSVYRDVVEAIEDGNTESIPAEVLRTFSHFAAAVDQAVEEEAEQAVLGSGDESDEEAD